MCPLRLILIFLSATLAGFFVLRNLKSQALPNSDLDLDLDLDHDNDHDHDVVKDPNSTDSQSTNVRSAIKSGFWTCVDMASGRYLWRHLVSKRSPSD